LQEVADHHVASRLAMTVVSLDAAMIVLGYRNDVSINAPPL